MQQRCSNRLTYPRSAAYNVYLHNMLGERKELAGKMCGQNFDELQASGCCGAQIKSLPLFSLNPALAPQTQIDTCYCYSCSITSD